MAVFRSRSEPGDIRSTLTAALNGVSTLVGGDTVGVYVFDSRRLRVRHRLVRGGVAAIERNAFPHEDGDAVDRVLLTGQPERVDPVTGDGPHPGASARMVIPIIGSRGTVLGALDMMRCTGAFDRSAVDLVSAFAPCVATGIETTWLYRTMTTPGVDREAEVRPGSDDRAAPSRPTIPGVDAHVHHETVRPPAGDACELWPLGYGRWGVMVANVSGRDVQAALLVSGVRALIRSSVETGTSPEDTARRIHRFFTRCGRGRLVTLFYGILDPTTRTLRYVNAGRIPLLVRRRSGTLERLDRTGAPLGGPADPAPSQTQVTLEPDDVLVGHTDGVGETTSEAPPTAGGRRSLVVLRVRDRVSRGPTARDPSAPDRSRRRA